MDDYGDGPIERIITWLYNWMALLIMIMCAVVVCLCFLLFVFGLYKLASFIF